MSHAQRGITLVAITVIAALVLVGAGVAYYISNRATLPSEDRTNDKNVMEQKEVMMDKDTSPAPTAGDTIMNKASDTMMKQEATTTEEAVTVKYSGNVVAGTSAPLIDFNKADFDAAISSDKLVVLYFFANWCPICAAEFPKMQSAFNELTTDQVIGFRVNFNDNQTDNDEITLARTHGIAYQHTKVVLKNGQQILKSPETWEKNRYITEITKALSQ